MSRAPLRFAVAGAGSMAAYHVRRFGAQPGLTITACYDRDITAARAFAEANGIPHAYESVDALIGAQELDGLTVASADIEHYALSEAALAAGIPLFVEKPLAATVNEADALAQYGHNQNVARAELPVVVNFSKINYPAVFGAVKLLQRQMLGAIRHLRLAYKQSWIISTVWGEWWTNPRWLWRISSSHGGGGALRDLGSHIFFLLIRLCGGATITEAAVRTTASRAAAAGSGFSCDENDTFSVRATCANGAAAELAGGFACPDHVNTIILEAECEQGSVSVDLSVSKDQVLIHRADGTAQRYRFSKVYSTYAEFRALVDGSWRDLHEFPPPSLQEGISVQHLIHSARDAARR